MTRALLLVLLMAPTSAHADSWDWVGRAVQDAVDVGPEASVLGVASSNGRVDLALEGTLRWGIYEPTRSWFARPGLEMYSSFVFPVAWDWWQVRVGVATCFGPVGLGLAWVSDFVESGSSAFALGAEVRVRHRFGEGRMPSWGMFARADVATEQRELHDDRVSLGMFGAFDFF
jgi:hypothetical protein